MPCRGCTTATPLHHQALRHTSMPCNNMHMLRHAWCNTERGSCDNNLEDNLHLHHKTLTRLQTPHKHEHREQLTQARHPHRLQIQHTIHMGYARHDSMHHKNDTPPTLANLKQHRRSTWSKSQFAQRWNNLLYFIFMFFFTSKCVCTLHKVHHIEFTP